MGKYRIQKIWQNNNFKNRYIMKSQHRLFLKQATLLSLLICFSSFALHAQMTSIPDPIFEQALIDLGIDSDGIINGQVLTSDIELVTTLDLDHRQINDLTGLEGFAALEILNANGNLLTTLDISQNVQLKKLYCSSDSVGFNMMLSSLDISNNVNMELLYGENLIFLETLNLKNANNSILRVELSCFYEGYPCELSELRCIQVDDETAATNGDFPYNTWFIEGEDYRYSEDCTLGVPISESELFSVHQNPVFETLNLNASTSAGNGQLQIFNLQGKLLIERDVEFNNQISIDVSHLPSGLYFLNITTDKGNNLVKKFVKE